MKVMVKRLVEDDFDWLNGWMWDRSRAIRVELNKNYRRQEDNDVYVQVYEMCIRFHLLSMHQMARSKALGKDYDRHTDWEQLSAALNQMKELWDKIKVYEPQDRRTPCPLELSRVTEIHAYNIIVGLKEPEHREEVRRHPRVRTAHAIVRAAEDTKNPVAFWQLMGSSQVSYLMACAAATRFNAVRIDTLEAMVKAYMVHKQKVDELTLPRLVDLLGFDDEAQVTAFCAEFGGEFETDHDGTTRLRPETLTMRHDPAIINKQMFSQKYVENKRGGRNLAAVLLGQNINQARAEGLIEASYNQQDADSLFVPHSSTPSNPTSSNPFAAVAAQTAMQPRPAAVQPGLFNPSKDPIKFSTPSATSTPSNPFANAAAKLPTDGQPRIPTGPAAAANPFASFAKKAPPTGPSNANGAATPTPANAFQTPAATSIFAKSASSSGLGASATPSFFPTTASTGNSSSAFGTLGAPGNGSTTASASSTSTPAPSLFQTSAAPSSSFPSFSLANPAGGPAGSAPPSAPSTAFSGFTGFPTSSGLSLAPNNSATITTAPSPSTPLQPSNPAPIEDKKQKEAELAQQKAREEEERKAKAEEQRKAEEERRWKIQEEQAKARAAEQERRLREQEEAERRRAEQEAERLRLEHEATRKADSERKRALQALGTTLFSDPRGGLLQEYIQHLANTIATDIKKELRAERQAQDDALADEMAARRRLRLATVAFRRWYQYVAWKHQKAEAQRARERRRKLRAETQEKRKSVANSAASTPAPEVQSVTDTPVDRPLANGSTNGILKRTLSRKAGRSTRAEREDSTQSNGDFSRSYYEARARSTVSSETQPIVDRTETNYFKLLAMGIEPSAASDLSIDANKSMKRSFGSTDSEDVNQAENKRIRRSTSSLDAPDAFRRSLPPTTHPSSALRQSLPAPTTDEERSARYRAIKESLARSGHRASQSIDGGHSVRESMPPSSRHSTPFGRSVGEDKPKYWARQSRFVPQHLYGQPDAIRTYRMEVGAMETSTMGIRPEPSTMLNAKARASEVGFLSSPVRPALEATPKQVASEALVVEEDGDADTEEDAEEEEVYEEYEVEDDGYNGVYHEVEEVYDESEEDEDEDEDEEEEESSAESAGMRPGATQDDAIELSD